VVIIAIVIGYLIMGGFTGQIVSKIDQFDEVGTAFGAIFWPGLLPVVAGVWLGRRFQEWRTRPERVARALNGH
jgi:hypothetical protein